VAVILAPFTPALHAQWVYINDNDSTTNLNSVWGFSNVPVTSLVQIPGEPNAGWLSGGTSSLHTDAVKDQATYNSYGTSCLFISEPLASTGFPNGDIAAYKVNSGNGILTLVGQFANPVGNSGTTYGIALTTRVKGPTLYAGYSTSNTIVSWQIDLGGNCKLTPSHQLAVLPLNGGQINGLAESHDGRYLVATYLDGSIESFETPQNGTIVAGLPSCPSAINSTGYINQGSFPAGVDITKDSKYAVFGDRSGGNTSYHGPTELETVRLPITCARVTKDFGGTAVASATNLGSNIDSTNVWISPNEQFIYVTNNGPFAPQGFTTAAYNETLNTMSLALDAPQVLTIPSA
jgi:hypothetical protein